MNWLGVVAKGSAEPLTGEQLLFLAALIVVTLWVCSFLEESAEIEDAAQQRRLLGPGPKPR